MTHLYQMVHHMVMVVGEEDGLQFLLTQVSVLVSICVREAALLRLGVHSLHSLVIEILCRHARLCSGRTKWLACHIATLRYSAGRVDMDRVKYMLDKVQ